VGWVLRSGVKIYMPTERSGPNNSAPNGARGSSLGPGASGYGYFFPSKHNLVANIPNSGRLVRLRVKNKVGLRGRASYMYNTHCHTRSR
jgi:hypothetical protein